MHLVSVIIPNFNHAQFLKQRIDSVLNQTYQNFEVIILDDCSKDNSKNIIERYRNHPKISHVIYNEQNSGNTFEQWKKGILLSSGDFIWFAESDDYADFNFLEKLVPIIESNNKIGLIYSNSHFVNAKGEIFNSTQGWFKEIEGFKPFDIKNVQNGRQLLFGGLVFTNLIPNASAVLFRKNYVIGNFSIIDSTLTNCGDWKLWINIFSKADIAICYENLNYFRKHSNNVTNSDTLIRFEIIRILKEFILITKKRSELSRLYQSLFIWSFNPAYWNRRFTLHHKNIMLFFKDNLNLLSIKMFFIFLIKYK